MGKYHCTVDLLFDWFGISRVTTDNFCFYLQNRRIQTSQTGGQWYSVTSPFCITCLWVTPVAYHIGEQLKCAIPLSIVLVFLTHIRLDFKGLPGTNTSLLGTFVNCNYIPDSVGVYE
jgi:hypothetical protein